MQKIKLETLYLDRYSEKYKKLKDEFNGNSSSRFVDSINDRLESSALNNNFSFQSAYVILDNENPVGYVYISNNVKDEVFLELSILKDKRNMGYGSKIINELSDYLFNKYNIRFVKLDIDPSNINSVKTAEACGFLFDEEEYERRNYIGRMVFYKESECYINKRRK